MDNRDQGYQGEYGRNRYGQGDERRYGEEAYAYSRGRGGDRGRRSDQGREGDFGQRGYGQGTSRTDDYGQRSSWRDEEGRSQGRGAAMQGGYGDMPPVFTYTEVWLIQGPHTGRGPRGYQRSDERIKEEVCERLTQHGQIDASDIDVDVQGGEVTLHGEVDDRRSKRQVEDAIESIAGVRDVHNQLRVRQGQGQGAAGNDQFLGSGSRMGRQDQHGGMATSSGMMGTGTQAETGSAPGSATEGTQQRGGGSKDHGSMGTVNTGSGAGLSSGNATPATKATPATNATPAATGNDADWQRQRGGFQQDFAARQGKGGEQRTWEQAEPNYRYGYEAARSGRYQGRRFDEAEPELRRDYESQAHTSGWDRENKWEQLREEVREGFDRVRQS